MASRLARSAIGGSAGVSRALRPAVLPGAATVRAASVASVASVRHSSSVPTTAQDPKTRAQSLIDAIPGNSMVSKTAMLSTFSALGIYGISNEFYVFNEETVIMVCLLTVWTAVIKFGGPAYKQWAEAQNLKIKNILNAARESHTDAVQSRIASVKEMSGVVDVTKTLFEVSKETARLEAKAFELEQSTAIAAEAKAVLDSWVRYESQVKARQQKELADSVISRVTKELQTPKNLATILQQSVAEVEKILAAKK